jgi:SAM-dependent methyltransferase
MSEKRSIIARITGRLRFLTRKPCRRLLFPRWLYVLSKKTTPISSRVGVDRGTSVDRVFIERFLTANADRIRGVVLEVKDRDYTTRFGGDRVTQSDVLDINRLNTRANIYADIRDLKDIPDETYDCFILTQVLQYVDDLDSSIRSSRRILKPGGCLLVTVPTVGKLDGQEDLVAGHYWRLTRDSACYLFGKHFDHDHLQVQVWGNVLVGASFLQGLAAEEIPRRKLDFVDPKFACGVTILGVK